MIIEMNRRNAVTVIPQKYKGSWEIRLLGLFCGPVGRLALLIAADAPNPRVQRSLTVHRAKLSPWLTPTAARAQSPREAPSGRRLHALVAEDAPYCQRI